MSAPRRHFLGTWRCASGNTVDAFLRRSRNGDVVVVDLR